MIVSTLIHLQSAWSYLNFIWSGCFLNHCMKTIKLRVDGFFFPKFTWKFCRSIGCQDNPHFVPTFRLILCTHLNHQHPSLTSLRTQLGVGLWHGRPLFLFAAALTVDELPVYFTAKNRLLHLTQAQKHSGGESCNLNVYVTIVKIVLNLWPYEVCLLTRRGCHLTEKPKWTL